MESVRRMWKHQHTIDSCSKLKDLRLWGCGNLQTIFPSNFLAGGLQSLRILDIHDCRSLKEIFEVDSMKSVGMINKAPQEYLVFQNLNTLRVNCCPSLKYLLLTSVVKSLLQLEVLDISYCDVLEEIVADDEDGVEGAAPPSFLFPRLTSLTLRGLSQLKRFYNKMYALECPLLKKLEVCDCDKVELLFKERSLQGEEVVLDHHKQPFFLFNKV